MPSGAHGKKGTVEMTKDQASETATIILFPGGDHQQADAVHCSVDRYIRRQLHLRRKAAGLTVRQVADRAGLPLEELRAYENGEGVLYATTLARIADALGLSVEAFFPGAADSAYHGLSGGNVPAAS